MAHEVELGKQWNNHDIANMILENAPLDYQSRVPEATRNNMAQVGQALQDYRPAFNHFCDALVNRLGASIARSMIWSNPLTPFKRQSLQFGDTIQEFQTGLLKSHTYSADREYLEKAIFGVEAPPVTSYYHTRNRQEYYKLSLNLDELRMAFLNEGGLSSLTSGLMSAPTTSDQWDEFMLMLNMINARDAKAKFPRLQVADLKGGAATDKQVREFLKALRSQSANISFPSTKYNSSGIATFARPEDQILITTPEVQACIDVDALAAAFHADKADIPQRVITVPEEHLKFGKGQALLTTKDFFIVADTLIETNAIDNPVGRNRNYFLHHDEIISASRCVPALMFSTEATTLK